MNKIQYINLLKIRGKEELEKGESISNAIDATGGEPTLEEMVNVNKLSMEYFIEEYKKASMEVEVLKTKCESMEEDCTFMRALEAAGVDNWEGYSIAQDIMRGKSSKHGY